MIYIKMDSKKSPLALLAQTCSQIGADPPTTTTTTKTCPSNNSGGSSAERKKSEMNKNSPVLSVVSDKVPSNNNSSDPAVQSATGNKKKSLENNNRLTPIDRRSKSTSPKNPNRSNSSNGGGIQSVDHTSGLMSHILQQQQQQQQPSSIHPSSHHHHHLMMAAALAGQGGSSIDSSSSSALSLANSYKSLMAAAGMGPYGSPYPSAHHPSAAGPGGYGPPAHPSAMDFSAYAMSSALNAAKSTSSAQQQQQQQTPTNPFIPTSSSSAAAAAAMMNGYLASHPAAAAAAAYSAALQQAMQYGNVAALSARTAPSSLKSDSCRDPYCTGCPNQQQQMHMMICTAGCGLGVQCDHLKVPIPGQMISNPSSSSSPPAAPGGSQSSPNRPYVCNWIVADNYCGKRFTSSDDLLQHLRTHTNVSSSNGGGAVVESGPSAFAHDRLSMMRAAYPTPPLSPLSAARYHPYGKSNSATTTTTTTAQPGSFTPFQLTHPGMAAMAAMAGGGPYGPPPSSLLQHLNPAALAPYYSHLSLYGHHQLNQQQSRQQQQQQQQQPGVVPSGLGPAPGPP